MDGILGGIYWGLALTNETASTTHVPLLIVKSPLFGSVLLGDVLGRCGSGRRSNLPWNKWHELAGR